MEGHETFPISALASTLVLGMTLALAFVLILVSTSASALILALASTFRFVYAYLAFGFFYFEIVALSAIWYQLAFCFLVLFSSWKTLDAYSSRIVSLNGNVKLYHILDYNIFILFV